MDKPAFYTLTEACERINTLNEELRVDYEDHGNPEEPNTLRYWLEMLQNAEDNS